MELAAKVGKKRCSERSVATCECVSVAIRDDVPRTVSCYFAHHALRLEERMICLLHHRRGGSRDDEVSQLRFGSDLVSIKGLLA